MHSYIKSGNSLLLFIPSTLVQKTQRALFILIDWLIDCILDTFHCIQIIHSKPTSNDTLQYSRMIFLGSCASEECPVQISKNCRPSHYFAIIAGFHHNVSVQKMENRVWISILDISLFLFWLITPNFGGPFIIYMEAITVSKMGIFRAFSLLLKYTGTSTDFLSP